MTGLDYTQILARIVESAGSIFPYIAYSATPQQINTQGANPALPAVFVSPLGTVAGENVVGNAGSIRQLITEKFCVVVLFDNAGDPLAQNSANQIPTYREALRAALVNWHPLPLTRSVRPIVAGDDQMFAFGQGAWTAWIFNFEQSYQITTQDCYTPTPVTLTQIISNVVPKFVTNP